MLYGKAFFALQVHFAEQVARQFGGPLSESFYKYTTLPRVLSDKGYRRFVERLDTLVDHGTWAHQCYMDDDPQPINPGATSFQGHPLFGCFYYLMPDEATVRIHFVKNNNVSQHPLARSSISQRMSELQRMFAHIQVHEPGATTVTGNSWLYNLDAYCRLFPPQYIATRPTNERAEFQFLAFWGQCFDSAWEPKVDTVTAIFESLSKTTAREAIRWCFPYQALTPTGPINCFYHFYGV